jgi:integrative and conjugative element protein (TIGR02256 family)
MSVKGSHAHFFLNQYSVFVEEPVLRIWERHRQTTEHLTESFGALIGSKSEDQTTFWVESCTTPQPNDSATRTSFAMRDSFHQKEVESSFNETNGLWGYIGTWHTHPEPDPIPSRLDIADWGKCTERNPDRVLFFFIVGIEKTRAYMCMGEQFLCMNREGNVE